MKLLTIDSREVTGRPGVLLDSGDILDLAAAPSTLNESQWIPHSVVMLRSFFCRRSESEQPSTIKPHIAITIR